MRRILLGCVVMMILSVVCYGQPTAPAPPAAAPAPAPAPLSAGAQEEPTETAGGAMLNPEKTAQVLHAELKKTLEGIKSVHCKFRSFNRRDDLSNEKLMEFWYEEPLRARSLVLEGDNLGGVVTINAEGKLRGKKGGVLGLLVLNLEPTDERIKGLRGKLFYEGSWHRIERDFDRRVKAGWKMERKQDRKLAGDPCYVIAIEGKEETSKITRDVLLIDQKTGAMRQRLEFEGKVKVSDSIFTDIVINPTLDASLFYLE